MRSRTSKRRNVPELVAAVEARGFLPVFAAAATEHHVTVAQIVGDTSHATIMLARRDVVRVLREEHQLSYPEIGLLLDRDHSTIMSALRDRGAPKPSVRKSMRQLLISIDAALEELRVV